MVKSKIPFNTTIKINGIMKIRTIIREELLLKEFTEQSHGTITLTRERGLLSHITMKYVLVGGSFTDRGSPGVVWYSINEFKKLLMNRFKMGDESVNNVINTYLEIEKNKNFGV